MSPLRGPRTGHDSKRLTSITAERTNTAPSPMGERLVHHMTKFKQSFENPVKIPNHIVHPTRGVRDSRYYLDVGQIRED